MSALADLSLEEQAAQILTMVRDDPSGLPDCMSLELFKAICEIYGNEGKTAQGPIAIIIDGTVFIQLSDLSPLQCQITSPSRLNENDLTFLKDFSGAVYEVSKLPRNWLLTIASELRLLGWWGLASGPVIVVLMWLQTTKDLHEYSSTIVQLLSVTFVLYGLVRTGLTDPKSAISSRREFLGGNLGALSNDEWAVGVIAVSAILLSLLGLLLTTPSAEKWSALHALNLYNTPIQPVRILMVTVLTLATLILMSFYRTVAFYYWQRARGETLAKARDQYFESQYQGHRADLQAVMQDRDTQHDVHASHP